MNSRYMMNVEDVVDVLGVSKGHAYKIIRELNRELEENDILLCPVRFRKRIGTESFTVVRQKQRCNETTMRKGGLYVCLRR